MTTIRSFPVSVLVLAAAACAVAAVPAASAWLSFDRGAILNGEIWRLVTGHLVHSSLYHLMWNLAGLVGLGWLFGREIGQKLLAVMLAGAMVVSGGLILLDPGLELYVGLSGVLNTLLVAGALASWRQERAKGPGFYGGACLLLIVLSLAKIAVEAGAGTSLFTDPGRLGGFAVPLAHALGALAGVMSGTLSGRIGSGIHDKDRLGNGPEKNNLRKNSLGKHIPGKNNAGAEQARLLKRARGSLPGLRKTAFQLYLR